jgi:hypothetical protein
MADKWKKLSQHLEAHGKRAPATVVEVSSSSTDVERGGFGLLNLIGLNFGERYSIRRTTLRIRPDGEPEFEASPKMKYEIYTVPDAGDQLEVLYDPTDHEKVMVAPPPAPEQPSTLDLRESKVGFTLDFSRKSRRKDPGDSA